MLDQVIPPSEGPPAEMAAMWSVPAVDLQVSVQTLLPAEVSTTETTAVRFLSSVDSLMDLHPLDGAALLPADIAGAALFLVGTQVVSQCFCGVEVVPAGSAAALGLLAVVFGMPD